MTIERLSIIGVLACWRVCAAQPAPSPETVIKNFVGTWQENEAKRQIGSAFSLRFRQGPNGGLEELRGPEARPLVQPVRFTGQPYGTDDSKNTIALEAVRFEPLRAVDMGRWEAGDDEED